MGQILHGSATTTHAIRAAIQRSEAPLKELATQHGLNQKTVAKWRKRAFVHDAPMGPKNPRSTVMSAEEEAAVVAFRRHTLLPLDDCLYALQATIPQLTRSSLHRCFQRHGISRLPQVEGDKTARQAFRRYPIGYFHIDIAEVRTEEGKLHLFVAVDRTSKFAFAQLHKAANVRTAAGFLEALLGAVPYRVHTVLTDNGVQFCDSPRHRFRADGALSPAHVRSGLPRAWDRPLSDQAQPSLDQWPSRADEPDSEGRDRQTVPLRQPSTAPTAPGGILGRLQLRQATKNPEGAHTL